MRHHRWAQLEFKDPRKLAVRGRAGAQCDDGIHELLALREGHGTADAARARLQDEGVAGWAHFHSRPTAIAGHDFGVASGSIGAVFADTVARPQKLAIERQMPIGDIRSRRREDRPDHYEFLGPAANAAEGNPDALEWKGGLFMALCEFRWHDQEAP
ncbi:hypothetical protein ASH02_25130 [Nocardioides sp. Soil796]|nr:hypothetical protein ASH02_25130 [Nocardioides sp. Soil796]